MLKTNKETLCWLYLCGSMQGSAPVPCWRHNKLLFCNLSKPQANLLIIHSPQSTSWFLYSFYCCDTNSNLSVDTSSLSHTHMDVQQESWLDLWCSACRNSTVELKIDWRDNNFHYFQALKFKPTVAANLSSDVWDIPQRPSLQLRLFSSKGFWTNPSFSLCILVEPCRTD